MWEGACPLSNALQTVWVLNSCPSGYRSATGGGKDSPAMCVPGEMVLGAHSWNQTGSQWQ